MRFWFVCVCEVRFRARVLTPLAGTSTTWASIEREDYVDVGRTRLRWEAPALASGRTTDKTDDAWQRTTFSVLSLLQHGAVTVLGRVGTAPPPLNTVAAW